MMLVVSIVHGLTLHHTSLIACCPCSVSYAIRVLFVRLVILLGFFNHIHYHNSQELQPKVLLIPTTKTFFNKHRHLSESLLREVCKPLLSALLSSHANLAQMHGLFKCILERVTIFALSFLSVWMLLAQLLKILQKAGVFGNMSLDDRSLQDMEMGLLRSEKGARYRALEDERFGRIKAGGQGPNSTMRV